MRLLITPRLRALACGLLMLVAPGCSGDWFRSRTDGLFGKKKIEPGPQVTAPKERIKAMQALVKGAPKMSPADKERESLELARAIQKEEDPLMRLHILRTLSAFDTPASTAVLKAATKDADRDVRVVCCEAWAKRGGPDAVISLGDVFQDDKDLDVRIAAARGLGELKDPAAIPKLAAALDERDPAMQYRAMQSLQKISGKDYGDNINAWREFARGGQPAELNQVERVKKWL